MIAEKLDRATAAPLWLAVLVRLWAPAPPAMFQGSCTGCGDDGPIYRGDELCSRCASRAW